jgi:hypothetical protein
MTGVDYDKIKLQQRASVCRLLCETESYGECDGGGGTLSKHILIDAKVCSGKEVQKVELTGRSLL